LATTSGKRRNPYTKGVFVNLGPLGKRTVQKERKISYKGSLKKRGGTPFIKTQSDSEREGHQSPRGRPPGGAGSCQIIFRIKEKKGGGEENQDQSRGEEHSANTLSKRLREKPETSAQRVNRVCDPKKGGESFKKRGRKK